MTGNERSIVKAERKVNGVDIVVFIHDVTEIILKSKTYIEIFINALTRYLSKVITLDIPEAARNITVFIGDTIGEIKLGWRESKINLDIKTLELITNKYGNAIQKAENDPTINPVYRAELIHRLEDQLFSWMDKYSTPSY